MLALRNGGIGCAHLPRGLRQPRGHRFHTVWRMMSDEKSKFLVMDDYGMGGLWGVMLARSAEEIHGLTPSWFSLRSRRNG
jgi:hypothetical protein